MDGLTVKHDDPSLRRVQGRFIRKGMVVLKDAVLKEVVKVDRYKRYKRRWTNIYFDDGTDLAIPYEHSVHVLQDQMKLAVP